MKKYSHLHILLATAALALALLSGAGCASIGSPGGGPRDEDPPRPLRSNPENGAVNVDRNRLTIDFNEIVNVRDAFSKVVVSPTSASMPRVSSSGHRVTVDFNDTLLPNTTYTIDFADAIEDNNEANKLRNYTLSFSTGPVIDTLRISGMVLGAQDLEPRQGMLVGVVPEGADTLFSRGRLTRVAKTNDRGRFIVRGLKEGTYHVYAIDDVDNDYSHRNPEEEMAFLDYTVTPFSEQVTVSDSIWNLKEATIDTVMQRQATRFLPNDILLRSFAPDAAQLFLASSERVDSTRLRILMSRNMPSLPEISIVGAPGLTGWYDLERSEGNDTLTYWLRHPSLIAADTLRVSLTHLRTDSLRRLTPLTDTLRFVTQRPKANHRKDKKTDPAKAAADSIAAILMNFTPLSGGAQEVYLPLLLQLDEPPARLDTAAFRLETLVDSTWTPVKKPVRIERSDTLSPRNYKVTYPWSYDTRYRLTIDTLAATGIYGRVTRPLVHEFTSKKESDYCSLTFNIQGWEPAMPAFVELLNASDSPVRREKVADNKVTFRFLPPGKYYARIFEDFNGDGLYTTGDHDSLRQPDMAFYYPKAINLTKNWDKNENWDVWNVAVDLQKPKAIKKNKPESDKRRRDTGTTEEEEEEEEDLFDPTRNPFDPNDRGRRRY